MSAQDQPGRPARASACPTGARSPSSEVAGSEWGWGWVGRALGLESESPGCQSDPTLVPSEEGNLGRTGGISRRMAGEVSQS